jgi:hypothetical protein
MQYAQYCSAIQFSVNKSLEVNWSLSDDGSEHALCHLLKVKRNYSRNGPWRPIRVVRR